MTNDSELVVDQVQIINSQKRKNERKKKGKKTHTHTNPKNTHLAAT